MQSQTKMLRTGIAAANRSASVLSAGTLPAAATLTSVRGGAEDNARIEICLAPDEPARDLRLSAGVDDEREASARCVGDRHEHRVGMRAREDAIDLRRAAEDRNA